MPPPLKILTVIPDFDRRGAQRVGQLFSLAFRKRGHDVAVLPLLPEGPRRSIFQAGGIHIFDAVPTFADARAQAQAFAPDVVHVHRSGATQPWMTPIMRDLRELSRVVVETNIFGRYDPDCRDLVDVHFQITRSGLYRWNRLAPPPERRPSVGVYLPNVMDFSGFTRAEPERIAAYRRDVLGAREGDFVLGRVGKADPRIIDRFASVCAAAPGARLASVGLADVLGPAIARQPAGVRERIVQLPLTDSDAALALFYSSVDALLHWSEIGESFGMVLAESIACGTPVVMPLQLHKDIGGIEVIGHGEGGLIAGHAGILDRAALRMIADRAAFDAGPLARARARLVSEYDEARVSERAIDAMRVALDAKARGARLADAFAATNRFETTAGEEWFRRLIRQREGGTTLVEAVKQRATHSPAATGLLRAWQRSRH